jgi:hypothetical protein
MSFNGRVARIEQELRRRGRIKTPVVYFNDPEADLDEYRLPDWVADKLRTIELGRPGCIGGQPESTADWIERLTREALGDSQSG